MKKYILFTLMALMAGLFQVQAQDVDTTKTYMVIKNDGTEYVGRIMSKDARELLLRTDNVGDIYIPMHEVKEIQEVDEADITPSGTVMRDDVFATRYMLTTNGLPMKKGESYINWYLFGPDFQFGVAENVGVGVMTTWLASPLVGTFKYSIPLNERKTANLGLGTLVGTLSWAQPDGFGALPFASLTLGDRKSNVTLTGGFLYTTFEGNSDSRGLFSVAAMTKVGNKVSLVFDSVIAPPTTSDGGTFSYLIPALRIQTKPTRAFQFGFGGIVVDGDLLPFPVPMINFFQQI